MKNFSKIILAMIMTFTTIQSFAYDFSAKNSDGVEIWYNILRGKECEVARNDNERYSGSVNIPSSVTYNGTTYSVTSIGDFAFENCSNLTQITFPNSITTIGNEAFANCINLSEITIPNSVTLIKNGAFLECIGLKTINFNATNCTEMGGYYRAFFGCKNVTTINIGENVQTIPDDAFSGGRSSLKTVNYNAIDCNVSYGPFNSENLTTLNIGEKVKRIPDRLFESCSALKTFNIPNSVTYIGKRAFTFCEGLTTLTIPDSVNEIGDYAFFECSGLTSVTICNTISSVGKSIFCCCPNLRAFYGSHSSADNRCFVVDGVLNSFAPYGIKDYVIPNTITSIGESAFESCDELTSVTIGNSVTSIEKYAFCYAKNLNSVSISNSVTSIGKGAFWSSGIYNNDSNWENGALYIGNCLIANSSKTSPNFIIKDGTRVIADGAFVYIPLTSITIPNSVTSIGSLAFYTCSGITSVTIPNSVTSIGGLAFPSTLTEFTFNATNCTKMGGYVERWDGSFESGNYSVFSGCANLSTLKIGEGVKVIPNNAFSECNSLTSLNIPNSVVSIGEKAFYECRGITSVTIGNSVTSIGDKAFSYCKGLTSVSIGNSLKTIGKRAFDECNKITSISLPSTLTSVGESAFDDCSALIQVYVRAWNAPTCYDDYIFDYSTRETGILYVPRGVLEKYMLAVGWRKFYHILEYDFAGVNGVAADKEVASVKYFNLAGIESDEPFDGMNVVITTYTDGTQNIEKVVK